MYGHLEFLWGLLADADIESEKYVCLFGSVRVRGKGAAMTEGGAAGH